MQDTHINKLIKTQSMTTANKQPEITPEDLSEMRKKGIEQVRGVIKSTMQKAIHSAVNT
jgi:hypothetical protein